jgi:2-(1,2-epoxy-1,2-dihydrophenyl)acetyl-CoA isomerase
MNYETIITEIKNKVGFILLNRPERLNSFDLKLGEELYQVLRDYSENNNIRAIVIKGSCKAFCAGGDVKEMYRSENKSEYLRDLTINIHKCVLQIRTMEKPVIAVVNGPAFGAGLALALACDIIIGLNGIKMSTAFISIGLAPGCGTKLLTQLIGYHKACEFILTSKIFTVEEGYKLGIINKIADSENLDTILEDFLLKFRELPPIAIGKAKMLINKSYDNDLTTHLNLESITASKSAKTFDFNEGITSFVKKRKPIYKGK